MIVSQIQENLHVSTKIFCIPWQHDGKPSSQLLLWIVKPTAPGTLRWCTLAIFSRSEMLSRQSWSSWINMDLRRRRWRRRWRTRRSRRRRRRRWCSPLVAVSTGLVTQPEMGRAVETTSVWTRHLLKPPPSPASPATSAAGPWSLSPANRRCVPPVARSVCPS